jgi:hypothetical protein
MDCHALTRLLPASVRLNICDQLCGLSKLPDAVFFSQIRMRVNLSWEAVSSWELEEETEFMQTSYVTRRHVKLLFKKTPAALRHLAENRIIVWFDTIEWGPQVTRLEDVEVDGRVSVVISNRLEMELSPAQMLGLCVQLTYSTTIERPRDDSDSEGSVCSAEARDYGEFISSM